jgi:hypothetical protein
MKATAHSQHRASRHWHAQPCLMAIVCLGLATGCAKPDTVLFVTKTSISVLDADTTPPEVSIAYNRTEGYIGPRYENGAVPPVYGSIESDAAIINPKVRQLYATGDAAQIITKGEVSQCYNELEGDPKLIFFGTTTNMGLKITFGATGAANGIALPNSFNFGFRRKEFSLIPLGKTARLIGENCAPDPDHREIHRYPSVIAAIDTTGRIGDVANLGQPGQPAAGVGLQTAQFIATGAAARSLAPYLRPVFMERALEAVGESVSYGPDASTAALEKMFAEDPTFLERARGFLATKTPPVSVTAMLYGAENAQLRQEVLDHLSR